MTAERHAGYDNGVLRITPTAVPPGLAIAGEIDEATYPALVTSLHDSRTGTRICTSTSAG